MVPPMRRPTLIAALVVLAVGAAAAFGVHRWQEQQAEQSRQAREVERETAEREREADERRESARLQRGSDGRMPPGFEGIALGQRLAEVRSRRPRLQEASRERNDGFLWMEETLGNGAQVLFGFHPPSERLIQLQVLSRIPVAQLAPHMHAMNDHYGRPSGIWDCSAESEAGVPTRRFTWRGEDVSIQDVLLIHESGISLTLYVAPTELIGRSLQLNACQPLRSRDDLGHFPIATDEHLEGRTVPQKLRVNFSAMQ